MAVIAVFNPRTGVGSTATAVNLLAALARRGTRPLGVDLDPAAALSRVFGLDHVAAPETSFGCLALGAELADLARVTASGIIVCPGHAELAFVDRMTGKGPRALGRLARELAKPALRESTVVLDCAPAFAVPTLNALFACDLLLVPIAPDQQALHGAQAVERALAALEPVLRRRLPRRYLLTRADPDPPTGGDLGCGTGDAFPADEILGSRIREDASVADALAARLDVFRHRPDSAGAADYEALAAELAAVSVGASRSAAGELER